ncbi:LANO_0D10506g1_1 [Lachancea nothofagi CBS 11611]|uniref:Signal peptidase subunit 3 n=1 Tax=Lachancea nothofagi CBS 11611 TaxID=1266666 RepID=A0A1G4JKJ4_9SACH|nr:LANO_0D10506g1_1 [Lachancea nothofagi CBS 11611]
MFSITQRFQQTSNQALSFAIFAAVFVVGTFWAQLYKDNAFALPSSVGNVQPHINVRTSRYYGSINGKPKENLKLSFDLDADLTPLFNWNTKQVFAYVTATYNGTLKPSVKSEVAFWDSIITDKANAHITLRNAKSKYSIWDIEEKLSERDLTFKLHWNIQPWVGTLVYGETTGETLIKISDSKASSKDSKKPNNQQSQ